MSSSQSSEQYDENVEFERLSPVLLLERGLRSVREGYYVEGVVYFTLAREKLDGEWVSLAGLLDALTQGHIVYWDAQKDLLEASKRFVKVDEEQQSRIASLETFLPSLLKESHTLQTKQPAMEQLFGKDQTPVLFPAPAVPFEDAQHSLPISARVEENEALPALSISCFGGFAVRRSGLPVVLCSNRNGQTILRYLITQQGHRASVDVLMATLWPEDEPEVAHHKLQVAVSALRRSLNSGFDCDPGGGYILCKNRVYQLNPSISLRTDVDEFLAFYQVGQQSSSDSMAIQFEKACQLYIGPYLTEDLYADWSFMRREQLSHVYLSMCSTLAGYYLEAGRYEDTLKWATAILKENQSDEAAHRQLIRAYFALGRRSDALRQFHRCQYILNEELGVQPMTETIELFNTILRGEIS
jgi:DNA-binding SARP family transcriptional activator